MRQFRTRGVSRMLSLAAALTAFGSLQLSAQNQTADTTQKAFDPITHEGYIEPPEYIKKFIDAPRNLNVSYSAGALNPSSRKYFVRTLTENMPALAQMGAPYYNLAGWQVDYRGNRSRNMTSRSAYAIELFDWEAGKTINVQIPDGARVTSPTWSPDGSTLAFFANFDNATHIYLADPATGRSRPLTRTSVLATNVSSFYWTGDSKSIVTVLIPDNRPPEPKEPMIATEPVVRVNENNRLRTRVLFDLLKSPHEMDLLEYHMLGQVSVIDVKSRAVKKVGSPTMVRSINAAPDAMFFRITNLDRPFSYFQQLNAWGTHELLIDATGKEIRELARRTLRDGEQVDDGPDDPPDPNDPDAPPANRGGGQGRGGRAGGQAAAPAGPDTSRRSLNWHPIATGQVFYQLSRTAPGADTYVDRFVHMANPADTMALTTIYETPNRIQAVRFSENGRVLFVTEQTPPPAAPAANAGGGGRAGGGAGRGGAGGGRAGAAAGGGQGGGQAAGGQVTTYQLAVFLDENGQKYTISQATGNAPGGGGAGRGGRGGGGGGGRGGGGGGGGGGGAFVMKDGKMGNSVVMMSTDGKYVFDQNTHRIGGTGDSSYTRPQVEKIEIKTGTRSVVYQSDSRLGETLLAPLDDDFNRALIRRQSATVVAQDFILDTRTKEVKQITDNKDYFAPIAAAKRRTEYAVRGDGLRIRVNVTLPADYVEGTKLPALFWFYPSEYDSAAAYSATLNGRGGGRGGGAGGNADPGAGSVPSYGPRTMAFITAAGYALVEPDAPIVATPGNLPNDNYIRDLRENLQAVITHLDTLKLIDRNRLALGGHSYGAFSTANAMVHTTFFKAGIAGDGNYNRTLTPNGFQRESRDLWQGTETYLEMSPILYADKLSGALLMYHSIEDQNVGTDPIHAPKFFHALQGLGKTVSLYMYPYEDHGPVARETVLDQWGRWVAWLDKYVKNYGKDGKIVMQQEEQAGGGSQW